MDYTKKIIESTLVMSEKGKKAVYDFIVLLNSWKQEKGEEKTTTKEHHTNPYDQNDTMRMIGKQNLLRYIGNEGIKDITQARGYELKGKNFDVVYDVFIYGCITGKKEERAKKKATIQPTKVRKAAF
jgi:hypothetical protein